MRNIGTKHGRFVTRQRIALEQSSHARAVLINRFTVKFANCDAVRSNPAGLGVKIDIPVEV
jgi:hypothetical protein